MSYLIDNLNDIKDVFKNIKTSIFYVTNVAERGVGLENIIPNYHIICIDYDDEVDYLEKAGVKVFCLEKELGKKNIIFRNSAVLLNQEIVKKYINDNTLKGEKAVIVVFKPSLAIEKIVKENNWKILNNSTVLSKELEDKFNFLSIVKSLKIRVPDAEIIDFEQLSYRELKKHYDYFVIQLKSGYAGNSTFFIRNNEDYINFFDVFTNKKLKGKSFSVKVSKFIKGVPITVNACITSKDVYISSPCYQITGNKLCTNNFSTSCGNDWGILSLSSKALGEINEIGQKIGKYLKDKQYKGIFGLDFIVGEKNDDVYLIEINPRFVASIPFYTKLEIKKSVIPILALHFFDFLGIAYDISNSAKELFDKSIETIIGAQLILRNRERKNCVSESEVKSGVYCIKNNELDFLRSGYSPLDLQNSNEFIILSVAKGRIIKPENEVFRIEYLSHLVSNDYHLTSDAELITKKIYQKLKLISYEKAS